MLLRRASVHISLLTVLTVSVSSAQFAWEPSHLTATAKEDAQGCNAIEVSWNPGSCGRFDSSTISLISDDLARNQTVNTASGLATFEGCDSSSRYEVVLKAGLFCLRAELRTEVLTGAGESENPTSNSDASRNALPRNPHIRQTNKPADEPPAMSGLGRDLALTPLVRENLSDRNKPLSTKSLKSIDLPTIIDVTAKYEQKNSTLTAVFKWKITHPEFLAESFWLFLRPCPDAREECNIMVYLTEASFTNLEFSSDITLNISASYNHVYKLTGIETVSRFKTPKYVEPIGGIFVARISPTEVYLGWPTTEAASDYEIEICRSGKCSVLRDEIPEVHLIDREPGATYDIEIRTHRDNFVAEYYKGSLQMLKDDYETPRIVSIKPRKTSRCEATYALEVAIASEVSTFEIVACSLSDSSEDCRLVKTTNISTAELSLNYFEKYEVEVIAVYKLPLGKEARRSSKMTIETLGTDPEAVENIEASKITANSFDLQWRPPKNVPRSAHATIDVWYEISTQSANWTTTETHLHVGDLLPFTESNFCIRAHVKYLNEKHTGECASKVVRTDASAPGEVQKLRVHQRRNSSIVTVAWDPPSDANGRLDFYVLEYGSMARGMPAQGRRVFGIETNVSVPELQKDTLYGFSVNAVNLNLDGKQLPGKSVVLEVTLRSTGHSSISWVWILLGLIAIVLLVSMIIVVACCALRRRHRGYQSV